MNSNDELEQPIACVCVCVCVCVYVLNTKPIILHLHIPPKERKYTALL